MNGAESLIRTLLASGVDTCFANPGTSEMHFVSALDRVPGMRCILATFEGVVTGAADGYARMAEKPAATLLHCAPGLGNGLANLHNAWRASVPMVNIVGDHVTHFKPLDPLLANDTEGWARPVSAWLRTTGDAATVGSDAAEAVAAARAGRPGIATLVLPSDVSWSDGGIVAAPRPVTPPARADEATIQRVAHVLRTGEPVMIMLGGRALRAAPTREAARIAVATGALVSAETFNTRVERGRGRINVLRTPYPVDAALEYFQGIRHLVLVEAKDPIAFFSYPGKPGRLREADTAVHVLAALDEDGPDALARLAEALAAPELAEIATPTTPEPARGEVNPEAFARSLAAYLPENAVVVDESLTFGFSTYPSTAAAAPHDWLQVTGGSIGIGIPLATGAAVGAPGRRVVNLQADGSALYTLQGLWTQARERLDVTTVIFANRRYEILRGELANVGAPEGAATRELFSLANPTIDWVQLARGFGVEAARAETMEEFGDLFRHANNRPGPFVIELVVP